MKKALALWALTPQAAGLARRINAALGAGDVWLSRRLEPKAGEQVFDGLAGAVGAQFRRYGKHIFIMATGIVVRVIAGLIGHKTADPAVVVMDEKGAFAISLLSGHLGGANELAHDLARVVGAQAVITTATDVNDVAAIDMVAKQKGLIIENPAAIKRVNMALVEGRPVQAHDPYGLLADQETALGLVNWNPDTGDPVAGAGLVVDDRLRNLDPAILVLRPSCLAVGIGCNRGTGMEEIKGLVEAVFQRFGLALKSIGKLASIDVKADEPGIQALADHWRVPLVFYRRDQLNGVGPVPNPSATVQKHVGAKSVCEAAAILAASPGQLIVTKQKTPNATVAVARASFI